MRKIVVFNENENAIIKALKGNLKFLQKENELFNMMNNENALRELAKSISWYPSILKEQNLGKTTRSITTLVDHLSLRDMMDMIFNIPTKAILGQSYAIAKINFFYMLLYLTEEYPSLEDKRKTIMDILRSNIFSIMSEEVFIAIVSDKKIPLHIRNNAGFLLANIWEYRIYDGVREFAPILNTIWRARGIIKPAYGTMLGISEMFRICEETDPVFFDFFEREDLARDEIDSLKEFLLGLSYEEMKIVTSKMELANIKSLNNEEILRFLGGKKTYPNYTSNDPRDMFKSFTHRKNNALYRSRANIEGPKKTIEEYIMCYLLTIPEKWAAI